jgi:hypothetical protein
MAFPLIIVVAAAAAQPVPSEPINVVGTRRYYGRPFISPMGEPFRQRVEHDDPLADWFNQADRNHDGYLTADEMVADADRFFAILDTNHNGRIDPDEIDYYEREIAPEVGGEPAACADRPLTPRRVPTCRASTPITPPTNMQRGSRAAAGTIGSHRARAVTRCSARPNRWPPPIPTLAAASHCRSSARPRRAALDCSTALKRDG